jgi:hypothetical protein
VDRDGVVRLQRTRSRPRAEEPVAVVEPVAILWRRRARGRGADTAGERRRRGLDGSREVCVLIRLEAGREARTRGGRARSCSTAHGCRRSPPVRRSRLCLILCAGGYKAGKGLFQSLEAGSEKRNATVTN